MALYTMCYPNIMSIAFMHLAADKYTNTCVCYCVKFQCLVTLVTSVYCKMQQQQQQILEGLDGGGLVFTIH